MNQRTRLLIGLSLAAGSDLLVMPSGAPAAQMPPVTAEEAHAVGVDAYLYFYPLVTMDITRKPARAR